MSLEERFGQYRQGKGALNTRQVFDLLKNEEKKQQKVIYANSSTFFGAQGKLTGTVSLS